MRDHLGTAAEELDKLQALARSVFGAAGFRGIRTPVLEPGRLFDRSLGSESDVVSKEMYTVEQGEDRLIALRPENTAGVVRSLIENDLMPNRNQLKVHYSGPMFRHERPQSGRLRQFHQAGLEVFGRSGPLVDAEVISLAETYLERAGIEGTTLLLNSIGCPACRPEYVTTLVESVEPQSDEICSDCQRRLGNNPLRILDCKQKQCQDLYEEVVPPITDYLCSECQSHFERLKELLSVLAVDYQLDPWLVRGLDYYTRTTFEIVADGLGEQDAVIAGGRYDDLVEQLGGDSTSAIGFSAGLERMMLLRSSFEEQQVDVEVDFYFVPLNESILERLLPVVERCRAQKHPRTGKNLRVEIGSPENSIKAQLRRANRYGADLTLICGPQEVEENQVSVKNMASGEQESLEFTGSEELAETLSDYYSKL